MINVGDKFQIIWIGGEASSIKTLILKAEGLWWCKNEAETVSAFNPLSSQIAFIVKTAE
jgi:hypothetical protein